MKFIGFDRHGAFDHRLDEIEDIKQHIEVVYQYVKGYVEQEQSEYELPDIDSDEVTCTLSLNIYKGQDGPFNIKLFFPLISEDLKDSKLNFRMYLARQHFFENELASMFKEFDINIGYPNKEYYEGIRNWRQL